MLLETIRLAFINMLICSNILNTIFNNKIGSFQARNIVFSSYVLAETKNTTFPYEPDSDYIETDDDVNGLTAHKFNLAQYLGDTNDYHKLVSSQDTLDQESKEGLEFLVRNLNFEISYTCSNPPPNPVKGDNMDKYNILGIPAIVLSKHKEEKSISIKFFVNFSRVKNMIIDGTNIINDFYKGLEEKDCTIADLIVHSYPTDEGSVTVYERELTLTNKKILLDVIETLKKNDFSNNKNVDEDYPLLGFVTITRNFDKDNDLFDSIPNTLTKPVGFSLKNGSSFAEFKVNLDRLINKRQSDSAAKKIKEISKAADLVESMTIQDDFKIRLSPMIPKKIFSNINTYMKERRKELLEKFDTDVIFFTTIFLLNRPPKIQIKGFDFTIDGKKLSDFNIVNLYKLCTFIKKKDEIKSTLQGIILQNNDNKNLIIPSTVYQTAAFSSNGVNTSNKQQKTNSKNSENTEESSSSDSNSKRTPKKQNNISGIIIFVSIGIALAGAIGGLVYSFIL